METLSERSCTAEELISDDIAMLALVREDPLDQLAGKRAEILVSATDAFAIAWQAGGNAAGAALPD
jgi:hypothetical protein